MQVIPADPRPRAAAAAPAEPLGRGGGLANAEIGPVGGPGGQGWPLGARGPQGKTTTATTTSYFLKSQLALSAAISPATAVPLHQVWARLLVVLWQLGNLCIALLVQGDSKDAEVQRRLGKKLLDTLTELGPCFIKLGQALSTRPDLVRRDWLEQLTRLQDDLPPLITASPWPRSKPTWGPQPSTYLPVFPTTRSPPPASARCTRPNSTMAAGWR